MGPYGYRGRTHTANSLALGQIGSSQPLRPSQSPCTPHPRSLRIVTWNSGGMHAARYEEVLAWLEQERRSHRPVHVLCVQETKWAQDSEYSTDRWHVVHSGSGKASAGILFFIYRTVASPQQLKHAALIPGRVVHLRVQGRPAVDLLGVYQHAWASSPQPQRMSEQGEPAHHSLLQSRARVWQTIESWTRAIPTSNQLLILGDLNCTLLPHEPYVGPGIAHHQTRPHPDQPILQSMVEALGLTAMNTWGRRGRCSGTYLHFQQSAVQIDFMFTRLPCQPQQRNAKALHRAPVVHPTGLRHVPVAGHLPFEVASPGHSRHHTPHTTSHQIKSLFSTTPAATPAFLQAVQARIESTSDIDACLQDAWRCGVAACHPKSAQEKCRPRVLTEVTLKTFWDAKRCFRQAQQKLAQYHAPVIWNIADAPAHTVAEHFPGAAKSLATVFQSWLAARRFSQQDKIMRQRDRSGKQQQVATLIQQAQASPVGSLHGLYQLSKRLRPKTSKRTIHFRSDEGMLLDSAQELQILRQYFEDLYQSPANCTTAWRLTSPLAITQEEVAHALHHTSANKALPPGHAPAVLWKAAEPVVASKIARVFDEVLQPGPLQFPSEWNRSYLVLLAKSGEPPSKPANLRPISLLPMLPKLLARIAAERLKPLLAKALHRTPQFAYLSHRQVADAVDRVASHCRSVRECLKGGGRSVFKLQQGFRESHLYGGMQLSLDLSKAYDRLPRLHLLRSLERLQAPAELVSLIMHIHDQAIIVISRQNLTAEVGMGRGIRQGCGLSPLLWLGFTLLLFDQLQTVLPENALTAFADDFHVQWQFWQPRDFHNAIPRILHILRDAGMEIALDKTAILLAIKGRAAPSLLKDFTANIRGTRYLTIPHLQQVVRIPIKTSHPYLGVHISYQNFELITMKHRLSQSWVAFHRLHVFLKHRQIPLARRVQLWQSCVWTIIQRGLTSVGVDNHSAAALLAQVGRQLRMVSRSPAHRSHESTAAVFQRLGLPHPLQQLRTSAQKRVALCRQAVGHLQPPRVHQWWNIVLSGFSQDTTTPTPTRPVEVTQVLQLRSSCPVCGVGFPSNHAVNVHIGKMHPTYRKPRERNPTIKNQQNDAARAHALHGLPTCRHCLKSFHAWPQFFGHFHQEACPVLHAHSAPRTDIDSNPPPPPRDSDNASLLAHGAFAPEESEALQTEPPPLFHITSIQTLARTRDVPALAKAIRQHGLSNHCPECNQWCTGPEYISRHAAKSHPEVRKHQAAVLQWLKNRGRIRRPCEFCEVWYKVRPLTHLQHCPILWACGHLIARFSSLDDPSQASLHGYFHGRAAAGRGNGRVGTIRGHDEADGVPFRTINGPSLERRRSPADGGRHGEADDGRIELYSPSHPSQVCEGRGQRREGSRSPRSSWHRQGPSGIHPGDGGQDPEGQRRLPRQPSFGISGVEPERPVPSVATTQPVACPPGNLSGAGSRKIASRTFWSRWRG